MATKARPSKVLKPAALGKPKRSSSAGSAPQAPSAPLISKESSQEVDPDLTRALKQIFEVRNCKIAEDNSAAAVTIFGAKLCTEQQPPKEQLLGGNRRNGVVPFTALPRQGSDKLPPAATAHLLKQLHKQRLQRRGITATPNDIPDMGEIEFVHTEKRAETMPLINCLQEKRAAAAVDCDAPEAKRQRVDLKLSIWSSPMETVAPDEDKDSTEAAAAAAKRSMASAKNVEQLTLFYNGSVYVYDDVPSDKATAIMVLASSISSNTRRFKAQPGAVAAITNNSINNKANTEAADAAKEPENVAETHQARKQSIQRFLEKRRIRFIKTPNSENAGDEQCFMSPCKNSEMEAETSSTTSAATTAAAAAAETGARRMGV